MIWIALIGVAFVSFLAAKQVPLPGPLLWYTTMSLLTFMVYAFDKEAARKNRHRVREATLHTLELAGGWPGALLAIFLLRHKSAKLSYRFVLGFIILIHSGIWIGLFRMGCGFRCNILDVIHRLFN
ncbi:MAG: DUF1294 domain-containing protein [Gammaproteobacteria bacterium]|nr:DUF1294 domain-containing protein [Gammaproteobacteria bacterium]